MIDQGEPIDNCIHVPVTVSQYITEIEYNEACTEGLSLVHFRILNIEYMNKDTYMVPKQAPLIIL